MSESIDLKKIEKKIIRTYYEGGIFELVLGTTLLGVSFGPFFQETLPDPWRYFLWPLMLIIIVFLIRFLFKRYFIAPRQGIVRLKAKKESTQRKLLIFFISYTISILLITLFMISGVFYALTIKRHLLTLIIALLFIPFSFSIFAYLIRAPRVYIIGILAGLTMCLSGLLIPSIGRSLGFIFSFGLFGLILILIGVFIFFQFAKNNPILRAEMISEK